MFPRLKAYEIVDRSRRGPQSQGSRIAPVLRNLGWQSAPFLRTMGWRRPRLRTFRFYPCLVVRDGIPP